MSGFVSTERRLVLRIEDYWNYLRGDRAFPSTTDIDPVELDDDWCDCFVMFPSDPPEDATFMFIGPRLLQNARLPENWSKDVERHVRDCPAGSMIARSVQYVGPVLEQRVPVTVTEVFQENGQEVRLRATLFPLSSDGQEIDAILGAANCARLEDAKLRRPAA